MNWLIIETSSNASCLVLGSQGRVIAHKPLIGGEHLSRTLAREVEQLLAQHPLTLDAIAVGTGPGSYTGIRIGAALGQSLAFGWNIPVRGFCSLAGYATNLPVAIDARGGGVYLLDRGQLSKIPLTELTANELVSPDTATLQQRLPEKRWTQASPDPVALLAAEKTTLQFRYL